jgi:hypothetical protein
MSWEFPAVSHTRIDFWKEPQYTRKGMFIFTVIFGMFGLHHLLFRSPQTWILFFLANIFSFGYFYWYDLIQLWDTPIEELNQFGLHSVIGPLGLAQGMFTYIPVNPDDPKASILPSLTFGKNQNGGSEEKEEESKVPNPWWFFLYTLLLPIQPLAKYIAGDTGYAMTSLLSLTIIPLGWLFSLVMMFSEYFNVFFKPKKVFEDGIHRVFPFTSIWLDESGHSDRLATKKEIQEEECEDTFFITFFKRILTIILPIARTFIPPELTLAIESAIQTKQKVVDRALDIIDKGTKIATQVGKLATDIPQVASSSLSKLSNVAINPQKLLQNKVKQKIVQSELPGPIQKQNNEDPQQGGGSVTNQKNYWDYAAIGGIGAVLGTGFLLHTGRSFLDAVHRVKGTSDEPPHT